MYKMPLTFAYYLFFTLTICVIIFLTGCTPDIAHKTASLNDTSDSTVCPFEVSAKAWFLKPPDNTVAGYPQVSGTALRDAKIRLAGYKRMFVKGKIKSFHDETYYNKIDSISFFFDSTGTGSFQNLQILDSMFICCPMEVYLATEDTAENVIIDTSPQSPCIPPHTFLPENYQDSVYLYGKGTCGLSYYNQAISWMCAEESAVKNLCRQSLIRISSITKGITSNDMSNINATVSIEMDIEVRNARVVARYYDLKSNSCIVWIACKKSDVIPWKGVAG
jgi:hypothetical protein